ncbi:MAG: AI-2E family transporter [Acetatifactor sp.]|nr:AI-2E family transporter [Acetatifactor sp.]
MDKLKENKLVTLLLLIGVVYFLLQFIVPLVAPVLVALLFLTIFGPFLKKMQEKLHIRRQIGALLLIILTGILLIGISWVLVTWIVGSFPVWMHNFKNNEICAEIYLRLEKELAALPERILPGVLNRSFNWVKSLIAVGGFLLVFVIAVILLAKDYDELFNRMLEREEYHVLLEVICGVIRYVATYVKAQLIIMSLIGVVAAATLGLGGIRQGFLWGILAGILDALPFVGTGVILIPLSLVRFVYGEYGRGILCIGLYVACIFLREILEPRLIGERLGVKPIAILLSLVVGIKLFGVAGILKGPLGFVVIYETLNSLAKKS